MPDQNEIPDSEIERLENPPTEKEGKEEEEKKESVPFHEDPQVQQYVERQVQKRIGEGNQAWEERLDRLERNLSQSLQTKREAPNIGGWTPANDAEARAAKAIIKQAKEEVIQEFRNIDEQTRESQQREDALFKDYLQELKDTNVLKDEKDEEEFVKLIVDYKINDQEAAVNLWNRLKDTESNAKQEGEKEGIKKMQEPAIGSGRKGVEPGSRGRTYNERRAQEPDFNAILERELSRLGQ